MNKLAKIATIIVILASGGSLFLAFKLGGIRNKLKDDNAQLTQERDSVHAQYVASEAQLKNAKAQLQQTQADLTTSKSQADACQLNLAAKAQEAEQLKTQIADKDQELQKTKADAAAAEDGIKKIQDALKSANVDISNIDQLRDSIVAQADENKVLGQQLLAIRQQSDQLKEQLEYYTTTPINLRGRVADVQENWNFVVLDIGRDQRVSPNAQFMVYRDNQPIGVVRVESVGSTTSVANILPEYKKGTPKVGDLAVH